MPLRQHFHLRPPRLQSPHQLQLQLPHQTRLQQRRVLIHLVVAVPLKNSSQRTRAPLWTTMTTRHSDLTTFNPSRRKSRRLRPSLPRRRQKLKRRPTRNCPSRANLPSSSSWTTFRVTRGILLVNAASPNRSSPCSFSCIIRPKVCPIG